MELLNLKNKNILPFRFKKLNSWQMFLSNDLGKRIILDEKYFNDFVEDRELPQELISTLISKYFLLPKDVEINNEIIRQFAYKWIVRNSYLIKWPSLHIIVATLYCNHACRYCHASAKTKNPIKYHMTKEVAQKVVDVIFQTTNGDINIEFQWWEPLSNWPVVKYVIEYAREKNKQYDLVLDFAVVTNLSLMNDEMLDFLIAEDISISTSLDWPKELHDENRKYLDWESSFDLVSFWMKKINAIYKEKNIHRRVGAIATATRKSLDYTKEIIDTYIDLWLENIFMRPLNPFGIALKLWDQIWYSDEQYATFYNNMLEYIKEKNKEWVRFYESYLQICKKNLDGFEKLNFMEERSPCGAVLGQVAYNRDGKIYTCDEWRMFGTMWDDSFKVWEIDLNKTAEELYKEMILCKTTSILANATTIDHLPWYSTNPLSNYIWVCPIYSYAQSGNIVSKYKKEQRFRQQEATFDKIFDDFLNDNLKPEEKDEEK